MSDPYQNDPYRNGPNRRVTFDNDGGSGMASLIGIVVVALLIVGGIIFYNANHGMNVASNESPPASSTLPSTVNPVQPRPPSPTPATPPASPGPSSQ